VIDAADFVECVTCIGKPGSPTLCQSCRHNRALISGLKAQSALVKKAFVLGMFPGGVISFVSYGIASWLGGK